MNTKPEGKTRLGGRFLALVLALAMSLVLAVPASAGDGRVTVGEDFPEGCVTATAEAQEQCGAQGRDHFGNAAHLPPIEACADETASTGSRITRVTPDGPRRRDGSLAFVSGACVYLPPGYDPDHVRYPTLYLLHGGGGDQADWLTFGDIVGILDRAAAADPSRAVIAVMPDGRSGQWYDYEDGSFRFETYVLDHLIPWVDAHLATIDDRSGRAIAGLSNGGYGAIHLAGKRPDLFVAAGGMSSNLGARTLSGLGEDGAVHHQGSVPYQLAENYDEVDLVLDVAVRCTSADPLCATVAVDLAFTPDHTAFDVHADEIAHRGVIDLRYADGAHQFTWWSQWLEERQLPFLQERLSPPVITGLEPVSSIPESFRFRSIAPAFSVWGTDVSVERSVREFLDLRDVSAAGFEIQGSGQATVTTAAYFAPGTTVRASGATDDGDELIVADRDGRVTVAVDLGPSHQHDEFTDEADVEAATADGAYDVVRTVVLEPETTSPPGARPSEAVVDATPPAPSSRSSALRSTFAGGSTAADGNDGTAAASGAAGDDSGSDRSELASASAVPERGPQLVPTIAFIATLAAGAALVWRRRRTRDAE